MGYPRPHVLSRLAAVLAGVLFLVAITAGRARGAEPEDPTAAARAHTERANRFYQVGAYREALDEYRAAHLAKPDPAFLFNAAQCLRQLGDTAEALKVYRRFLALAPDSPARHQAEKHIREIETGRTTAAPPALRSSTGAVPGSPSPPNLASSSPVAGDLSAATSSSPPASGHRRWLPWVGAGLTVALASGAVAAGLSANGRYDSLHDTCGLTSAGCPEAGIDRVKSRAHLSTALWVATGVAAAATGIAFYVGRDEGGVSVAGRF